jgi:hypothetical protein
MRARFPITEASHNGVDAVLWGSQSWLQPAFSRLLEFLHFSGISSADQGLIGDLETEWSE